MKNNFIMIYAVKVFNVSLRAFFAKQSLFEIATSQKLLLAMTPKVRGLFIRNNSAFTLIETLISMLILAIVMAGGMAFYFHSDNVMSLVTQKKIALEAASSKMEDLKRTDYTTLTTGSDTITVGDLSVKRNVKVEAKTQGSSPYKKVTVTVDLKKQKTTDGKDDPKMIELVSYMVP